MSEKWCPHGRIARFARSQGRVELISFGGFNITQEDNELKHQTPCIKGCMHYKRSIFPWGEGRCGLEPYRAPCVSIIFASVVVALSIALLKYL